MVLTKLDEILKRALALGASDVHIKAGIPPSIRRHGKLGPISDDAKPLKAEEIEYMAMSIMDDRQKEDFEDNKEIDLGYGISGVGRFRVNIFVQRGTVRIVIRNIPYSVPTFKSLNLPEQLEKISDVERGLVLVTGVTGSGKSSTLAAMIDHINKTKTKHRVR